MKKISSTHIPHMIRANTVGDTWQHLPSHPWLKHGVHGKISEKASLGGYKNTMTTYQHVPKDITPCPACGGSGETAYFGGESRFMLTREDCPDCCGTGVLLPATEPAPSPGETTPPEATS